jgi:RNA polymerase sigma factor (sigma-70 family)
VGHASTDFAPASIPDADDDTLLHERVRAAVRGDVAALHGLLRAAAPLVARAVRRVLGARHPDVEDVAQQALAGFVDRLPSFRGESSVSHFAERIAVYRALSARRDARMRAGVVVSAEPQELAEAPDGRPGPLGRALESSRRLLLLEALDALPPQQAEALTLHFLFDHTVAEIAVMVDAPVETVRSRLRHGKQALRSNIERDERLSGLREEWS